MKLKEQNVRRNQVQNSFKIQNQSSLVMKSQKMNLIFVNQVPLKYPFQENIRNTIIPNLENHRLKWQEIPPPKVIMGTV